MKNKNSNGTRLCGHANESTKDCLCSYDCSCHGKTCDNRAPFKHQVAEPKAHDRPARPSWHETWMEVAWTVGRRSYDARLQVGAIVVAEDNTSMLAVGYNGNYSGGPNTPESQIPGQSGFIHAEVNALIKCPYHYPIGKVMYVTDSPCAACAKCIVNAKIGTVVYAREYRDTTGIEILRSTGISVYKLSNLLVQK